MIVKDVPGLATCPPTVRIGSAVAHIQRRALITRAEDPSYFPPNYDPARGIGLGTIVTRSNVAWEIFKTGHDVANVPKILTDLVRGAHPGCTWQVRGMSLFAVSDALEVVAALHLLGGW
jgi:hypothetical protein